MKHTKKKSPRLLKKLTVQTNQVSETAIPSPQVLTQIPAPIVVEAQKVALVALVTAAMQDKPNAFGNVNDKRATEIARAVLLELSRRVENMQENEALLLPIFGKFTAGQVQVQEADGQQNVQRRVYFQATQHN